MEKDKKNSTIADLNKISSGSNFKGELDSNGDFRIDGKFEGTMKTKGRVVVGQTGIIEGTLICSNAEIEGIVTGNINVSEILAVKSSGVVSGDVVTSKLAIEIGAKFNVKCTMGEVKPASGLNNAAPSTK